MSKRSASSVPAAADRARLKRRMDPSISQSDSSSEPCEGSDCDIMTPLLLSCVYVAPPLVGPSTSMGEDELAEWRNRYSLPPFVVLRVPTLGERASSYIPGDIAVSEAFFYSGLRGWDSSRSFRRRKHRSLGTTASYRSSPGELLGQRRSSLWSKYSLGVSALLSLVSNDYSYSGNMSRNVAGDSFTAYQEVARVTSAKKGSSSRTVSGDEVKITGSRRTTVEKPEPSSSLQGDKPKSGGMTTRCMQQSGDIARSAGSLATSLSNLNLKVFPQDCTVLPIGDPLEVIQVLQVLQEEIEDLKRQASEEKDQRVARELEICDLKDKMKVLEKVAKASSVDALATSQENQELEEEIDVLKAAAENFKLEMVKAVNGASVVARCEWSECRCSLGTDEGMAEETERSMGIGQGAGAIQGCDPGRGQEQRRRDTGNESNPGLASRKCREDSEVVSEPIVSIDDSIGMSFDTPFRPSIDTTTELSIDDPSSELYRAGFLVVQGYSGNLGLLLGFSGHKIFSAHIRASLSTDTNAVTSIDSPLSPRQLSLARQTDHSSVNRA
ncbi:hypothetical protein DY000_02007545 [Brassica cretica]|uniref:Uncharacterized protein n=1 Tax=Brassica cretica TaxID=69181 RepID=A0ABQ7CBM4_BRACR|nr:hypothetical protein DY000_02007545 [Brassica cretica]